MTPRRNLLQLLAPALLHCIISLNTDLDAAILVGAGENLDGATGREGTGQRLNIDDYNTQYLSAGTYTIEDFAFVAKVQNTTGASSGGSVIPFLAVREGSQYRIIWRGSQTDLPTNLTNNDSAVVHGSTAGSFTLASDALIYSGFYSIGNAAVAYRTGYAEPRTDHANITGQTMSWANYNGSLITGVSLTEQPRSYAHGISIQATTDLRIGPGLTSYINADSIEGERLNIDRSASLTLGAGTHTVTSFSYFSTLATNGSLGGAVTPFLAKQTSENQWQVVWVGDAVANEILGGNEATLNDTFTLDEETTLHAGFFTSGGARVAFTAVNAGEPGTAHVSSSSFSVNEGSNLTFSSFPNLGRYYSFEILVAAVPEPGRAMLVWFALVLLTLPRRRGASNQ